ncbi:CBD9-like protein [Lojkania enalia]|uniref:CBD9-like protein n=1 Tax=Lojkania enalia TaxID=147567 RepID=A0A9P4N680_9PLEO|nr:CBD9-like protein [Didymosphaeria enalia]
MHLASGITWAAAVVGLAFGRPTAAAAYYDAETGFTFSEYKAACSLSATITYRVAIPNDAYYGQSFDAVLQVVAPNSVGWAGLAWGGGMVSNPLTVGWANGNTATVTSRWANSRSTPSLYTGNSLQKLSTGNRANGTHFQFTVLCSGCTQWTGSSGFQTNLNPQGSNKFAFACSGSRPSQPASNTSSFPYHDAHSYWSHDFSAGANADFANLVMRNGGRPSVL